MSENTNIEHRAFWEPEGRPYFKFEFIEAAYGRVVIRKVRIPTREEIIKEQQRRAFIERVENFLFLLAHFDFKYNVRERLKY